MGTHAEFHAFALKAGSHNGSLTYSIALSQKMKFSENPKFTNTVESNTFLNTEYLWETGAHLLFFSSFFKRNL